MEEVRNISLAQGFTSRVEAILKGDTESVRYEIHLAADSHLEMTLLLVKGDLIRCDLDVFLEGRGASCDLAGLCVAKAGQRMTVNVNLRHMVGGCTSRQMFKNILSEQARTFFHGLIYVAQDAQKTEAYQANHNLLLDAGAKAESKPQLEIYADDVICSHGATIGQLDEEQLFYMRSRGIPLDNARRLQTEAFASEIISRLTEGTVNINDIL